MTAERTLTASIEQWLLDEESDVEYAERVDGRWAVRMKQTVREATTVWFDLGERSLRAEAYVLPPGESNAGELHAFLLRKNEQLWRCAFSIDRDGAIFLRGRIAVEHISHAELELLLGEIYDTVESTFRTLLRLYRG